MNFGRSFNRCRFLWVAFLGLIAFSLPRTAESVDFVSLGSTWKFHRGSTYPSPTNLTAWRQPEFNDSSWESGPSGIGYGDNDDQTHLGDMSGNYWSVYTRQTFEVADLASVQALRLAIFFDDGFVGYLNGHEILRVNGGSVGQELSHTAPASGDHDANDLEEYDLTSHLHRLVAGENVLAFEIHNVTLGSSDLSFNARLSDDGAPINLFDFGTGWRYFRGRSSPPATWREPTFNHSSWEEGPTGIGYGDGDDATVLGDMEDNYTAVFLRKRFAVTNTTLGRMTSLHLVVDYDDGFIAYLNGQEVGRRNCGDPGQQFALNATATGAREAGTGEYLNISDFIDDLVIGDNFLAFEVRNTEIDSSDLSINVRLVANERVPPFFPTGASVGGGKAAFGDYNNDGLVDVIAGGIWRNDGEGNFTQIGSISDGIWADFNNDGFLDIFAYGGRRLYRNVNGSSFSDVTTTMLPSFPMDSTRGAVWGDFNNDGFVDLYVGGYEQYPGPYQPDVILMNDGGQRFTVAWTQSGDVDPARGITATDFDQDGDLDVYVSNYRLEQNQLWTNNGSGSFTNTAPSRGVEGTDDGFTWSYGHTIGSAFGDLDNDGLIDLFVGNFSHSEAFQDRPRFYRNLGASSGYRFEDLSSTAELAWQESFASPSLADMDNDGDLDLHFTAVYTGDDPVLYQNNRGFRFSNVTSTIGSGLLATNSYQSAWADIDNDGDLDVLTGGVIHENTESANSWLRVRLHGDGVLVNRAAIGAQGRVTVHGETVTRFVSGGTGEGNQNELTLHFGLGDFSGDEVPLEIFWPEGSTEDFMAPVRQTIDITYGETLCGVTRVVPSSYEDSPNTPIEVQLNVRNVTGITFVRERPPADWVVVDPGGGDVLGGDLQFVVSEDVDLSYLVSPGGFCEDAVFGGTFTSTDNCVGDIRGRNTLSCEPSGVSTVLVQEGDVIRYHKGTSSPPSTWRTVSFNDLGWLPGRVGIGYDDGDDRTTLTDMQNSYASVFGRLRFNPEDDGVFLHDVRALQLSVRFDDGCVLYLNGTEVTRPNMATGSITRTTLSQGHVDDAPSSCTADGSGCKVLLVSPSLLVSGVNILAFSVHNATLDSSDLSFIPRLEAFSRPTGAIRFRRGDVDESGGVDIVDAMRTLRWLFLGADVPNCLDSADADNDGSAGLDDPLLVLIYLFLAGPPPADPGPDHCGIDDDDALGCDSHGSCAN